MNKLIVILGPTASGKTELAIKLAKFFNGEIVNADSRQVYRGLDIGTNKPYFPDLIRRRKIREINSIPHYLIDVVKPDQNFTVADFKKRAIKIIKDIQRRKKIPFLVGGTGLYIQVIIDNLEIPKVKPDRILRNKLSVRSNKWLFEKIKKLDPITAKNIDPNNKRRLIRALEVCLKTKKPFSFLRKRGEPLFESLQIGIRLPRKILYQRINQRLDKMIKNGLVNEVKRLLKKYSPNLSSMSGIGYKEIISYLSGKINLKKAIEEIKKNTRHFARRQMTWFRRDKRIIWVKNYQEAKKIVSNFLA